jgi:hypothetical protein
MAQDTGWQDPQQEVAAACQQTCKHDPAELLVGDGAQRCPEVGPQHQDDERHVAEDDGIGAQSPRLEPVERPGGHGAEDGNRRKTARERQEVQGRDDPTTPGQDGMDSGKQQDEMQKPCPADGIYHQRHRRRQPKPTLPVMSVTCSPKLHTTLAASSVEVLTNKTLAARSAGRRMKT